MQEILSTFTSFFGQIGAISGLGQLGLILKGVLIYILIIWLACVIWVIKDVTNRSDSLILQVISILLVTGLTPIFGLPIYLLIRPSTTLFERYYEQSSLLALEGREDDNGSDEDISDETEGNSGPTNQIHSFCTECGESVRSEDHFCPHCGTELLEKCKGCGASLQPTWNFCNQCGKKRSSTRKNSSKPIAPSEPTSLSTISVVEPSASNTDTVLTTIAEKSAIKEENVMEVKGTDMATPEETSATPDNSSKKNIGNSLQEEKKGLYASEVEEVTIR